MKKSHGTVDVIIPTFNAMPWLQESIESVLGQTYQDFKIYIIDDGSTDDTGKYIKSISDERIFYIKRSPQGRPDRNLGVSKSNSPFVAFLDADDFWYPQKLEKQIEILKSNNDVGMVYGHVYVGNEEGVIERVLRAEKRGHLVDALSEGNIIAGSASMVLIRRNVLEESGLFREDLVNGEDWELWIRIAKLCEIDFVPEVLAFIRQHGRSTQTNAIKMAAGLVYAYDVIKEDLGLSTPQLKRAASYCLYQAAQLYFSVGERGMARKTLFYLFRENPDSLFNLGNWRINLKLGFFSRVVFGNKLFTLIHVLVHKAWHLIKYAFKLPFRLTRSVYRKVS